MFMMKVRAFVRKLWANRRQSRGHWGVIVQSINNSCTQQSVQRTIISVR